jgi:hypothetical protein
MVPDTDKKKVKKSLIVLTISNFDFKNELSRYFGRKVLSKQKN